VLQNLKWSDALSKFDPDELDLSKQINILNLLFPELVALHNLVEQNDWHNDDPYQQSLRLFQWVKRLPAPLLEVMPLPEARLRSLLSSTVDSGCYPLQSLLAFAALIHDVGKAETHQRLPDGMTRCPGHETVGARMAEAICNRFDFTQAETAFITTLVAAHGEPYALFKDIATLPVPQQQKWVGHFESRLRNLLLRRVLLAEGV
jgi:hypothetical protein